VIGAGGLGHIGIQCLAALTATNIIVVDRHPDALKLAEQLGAHQTVHADGNQVDAVKDLTGGLGADVVLDFVAEDGAENEGFAMTGRAGSYFVIGYGGTLVVPTVDVVSTERNIVGNIVGTYNDLAELMVLAQTGKVTPCTRVPTRSTMPWKPCRSSTAAGFGVGPSSFPDAHTVDRPSLTLEDRWPKLGGFPAEPVPAGPAPASQQIQPQPPSALLSLLGTPGCRDGRTASPMGRSGCRDERPLPSPPGREGQRVVAKHPELIGAIWATSARSRAVGPSAPTWVTAAL
jgi:Zinc-binding dehydrogenase